MNDGFCIRNLNVSTRSHSLPVEFSRDAMLPPTNGSIGIPIRQPKEAHNPHLERSLYIHIPNHNALHVHTQIHTQRRQDAI